MANSAKANAANDLLREVLGVEKSKALLLASDVQACRAYLGDFDGIVGEGGDCAHLDLSHMTAVDMQAHMGYIGQVSLLHESLPVPHNTFRTLVRLNIPGLVA